MTYDFNDDSQWNSWIPSVGHIFQPGEIFVLTTSGDKEYPDGIFKAEHKASNKDVEFPMSIWSTSSKRFITGHMWNMSNPRSYIRTIKGLNEPAQKSLTKNVSKTLFCNKCNDPNPWAEPNQKDGSFICFGCRR